MSHCNASCCPSFFLLFVRSFVYSIEFSLFITDKLNISTKNASVELRRFLFDYILPFWNFNELADTQITCMFLLILKLISILSIFVSFCTEWTEIMLEFGCIHIQSNHNKDFAHYKIKIVLLVSPLSSIVTLFLYLHLFYPIFCATISNIVINITSRHRVYRRFTNIH